MQDRLRAILFLFWLIPTSGAAFEARVLLPDGTAAAHTQVAIAGRPGSTLTDALGRLRIYPDPPFPVTIIVTTGGGEIYLPVVLETPPVGEMTIRLEAGYRESLTVMPGVAPTLEASPGSATVILGAEAVEEQQPESLADTLAAIPGVSGWGMGAPSVPAIRGLARGRTVILIDESRVSTERRAGASATFLDPFSFSSVEVARGPGSVAYGSDALGGVILVRPRDPAVGESSIRYELGGSAGAASERRAGIELTHSRGESALLVALHGRDGDEAKAGGGARILDSSFRNVGGSLRLLHNMRAGVLRLGYSRAEGRDIGKPEWTSSTVSTAYPLETSDRLSFAWDSSAAGAWSSVEVDAFAGRYRLMLDRKRLTTGLLERSDVTANDASIRMTATRPMGGMRLQIGGEVVTRFSLHAVGERRQFGPAGEIVSEAVETSIDDANRWDGGAFILVDRPISSRFVVTAGGRVEHVRAVNRGGWFGDRSTSSSAFAGHLAGTATLARGLTATAQVARGFRDPTLSDRYFRGVSGRGFVIGSPDLRAERSLQFDAALRWQPGRSSLALYGYHYRIRDLVERYRSGDNFLFRNHGESYVRGVELEGEVGVNSHLSAQFGAAVARGGIVPTGEAVDDIAAPGGHLALRWAAQKGFAMVTVNAFGRHDRIGPTERAVAGYTTVDAGFGIRLFPQVELRIRAGNVTDRRYVAAADEVAPWAPGRSISLGVSGTIVSQR